MFSLFAATLLAATIPTTDARIAQVTVYPDRAEVVRESSVRVPSGSSTIEFGAIPAGVEPDSLRIAGRGVAATIGAIEVRQQAHEAEVTAEYKAADAEVRRLEAAIAALDAQDATDAALRSYLDALRAANAQKNADAIAAGKPDPLALKAMLDFLRGGYGDLAQQMLQRREQKETLVEALAVARAKRAAIKPRGAIHSRIAAVEVNAPAAGVLNLEFSYVVPGTGWRPAYRATLDASKAQVDLVSEAVVIQNTGEDWSGVELTLSTAAPARGIESPVLDSWYLELLRPEYRAKAGAAPTAAEEVGAVAGGYANTLSMAPGVNDAVEGDLPAELSIQQLAAVVHTDYNAAFVVSGKTDVPSDGAEHRVTLQRDTLTGELAYRIVPSVAEAAYALALTKGPADRPLLSGPMRVIAGSAYLGSFAVPETAPGAELRIPFGIDNRIKVKRVVLPESRSTEGFVGRDRQRVFAFRTSVENFRDVPVTIAFEERVPKSQDERIEVKLGERTTPGHVELADRPGVLNWKLTLAPKEKREITLEYAVRWPKELSIMGL